MRMNDRTINLVFLVSAGLLAACASTNMISIRRKPSFQSDKIHHVLVIGLIKDQNLRKTFEEEFVRQWSGYGVKAVSSLDVLPSTTPLNNIGVAPIAKAQGFDAVIVTRLLNKKKITAGEPAIPYVVPDSADDAQNGNTILKVLLAPPVSVSDYDLATVESNLYDVASEQRVWSGISETKEMKAIPKLIPPFVKLILKRLYEIPR